MIATACISAAVGIVFGFTLGTSFCRHLLRKCQLHNTESRELLEQAEAAVVLNEQHKAEIIDLLQEARGLTSVKLKDVRA